MKNEYLSEAISGEDYTEVSTEFVLGAKHTSHCLNISILDDNILEETEQFNVTLKQGRNNKCFIIFPEPQMTVEIAEDPYDSK